MTAATPPPPAPTAGSGTVVVTVGEADRHSAAPAAEPAPEAEAAAGSGGGNARPAEERRARPPGAARLPLKPASALRYCEADHLEAPHQAGAGELTRVLERVAEQLPVVAASAHGGESTPSATGSASSSVRCIAGL